MRAVSHAVALLCLLALASSAHAGAKLTGDVFLAMQSGDVKRAADLQVLVVPASPEFMSEWEQVQTGYQQEVGPVVAEYDVLKQQYDSLAPPDIRDLSGTGQRNRLGIQLLSQMRQVADSRWIPLQQKYTQSALAVIRKHSIASTRTDVNGHFETELPPAKYFVYARYAIVRTLVYWLVPLEMQDRELKLSLSNSNGKSGSILRGRTYAAY